MIKAKSENKVLKAFDVGEMAQEERMLLGITRVLELNSQHPK